MFKLQSQVLTERSLQKTHAVGYRGCVKSLFVALRAKEYILPPQAAKDFLRNPFWMAITTRKTPRQIPYP
ncbi:MAG: hypothetical protein RL386_2002 [Bacteroidota bacterium]|jgi:hypothetical protein